MTKEFLESYKDKKIELESINRTLEKLDAELYSPKVGRLDRPPRGRPQDDDIVTIERVDEKSQLCDEYERKRKKLMGDLLQIERAIEQLPERESALLRMHYIEGLPLRVVSEKMNYSQRHVERILARATERLEEEKNLVR